MKESIRFDGRVAIITGSRRGLGYAHAKFLASRGAKIVINELEKFSDETEAVAAEIRSLGGKAVAITGQVGRDEDAKHLVAKTLEHFGRIDIIIHNAGGVLCKTPVEISPGPAFQAELDTHLIGSLQINRAAWPFMQQQNYGRILFTGSAVAFGWYREPHGYEGSYASAKSSLFGACRQTAAAGEAINIKANILMPWAYTEAVDNNLGNTEFGEWMKTYLQADQVAAGIAYLLHDECPVTGQAISVAGGRIARIFFATSSGYFNAAITPELVRDNWSAIAGSMNADGSLHDAVEITNQQGEFEIIDQVLRNGAKLS